MVGRWVRRLGILCLAVACMSIAADGCGRRYLARYAERYKREISEERQRAASYRRPVLFGEPLERNAATWYRLALAHLSISADARKALAAATPDGFDRAPATATALS